MRCYGDECSHSDGDDPRARIHVRAGEAISSSESPGIVLQDDSESGGEGGRALDSGT